MNHFVVVVVVVVVVTKVLVEASELFPSMKFLYLLPR